MLIKTREGQDDGGIGEKTGGEAIEVLLRAGLDNEMIAELVGTTPGTVRARRADYNKKDGKKTKGPGK